MNATKCWYCVNQLFCIVFYCGNHMWLSQILPFDEYATAYSVSGWFDSTLCTAVHSRGQHQALNTDTRAQNERWKLDDHTCGCCGSSWSFHWSIITSALQVLHSSSRSVPPFKINPVSMKTEYQCSFQGLAPPAGPRLRKHLEGQRVPLFQTYKVQMCADVKTYLV